MLLKLIKIISILAFCFAIVTINASTDAQSQANDLAIKTYEENLTRTPYQHINYVFDNQKFKINNNKLSFEFGIGTSASDKSLAYAVYGRYTKNHDFEKLTNLSKNNNSGLGGSMLFYLPMTIDDNKIVEVMVVSINGAGNLQTYTPIEVLL